MVGTSDDSPNMRRTGSRCALESLGKRASKSRARRSERKSKKGMPKADFVLQYLQFVPVILCARYLLMEHELGNREDIDRFAILLKRSVHTDFERRPQHAFFVLACYTFY